MNAAQAISLMKKQQKLHDMLFEAVSVIAVGVGTINPREIAKEALENYYKIGSEGNDTGTNKRNS